MECDNKESSYSLSWNTICIFQLVAPLQKELAEFLLITLMMWKDIFRRLREDPQAETGFECFHITNFKESIVVGKRLLSVLLVWPFLSSLLRLSEAICKWDVQKSKEGLTQIICVLWGKGKQQREKYLLGTKARKHKLIKHDSSFLLSPSQFLRNGSCLDNLPLSKFFLSLPTPLPLFSLFWSPLHKR